MTTTTTITTTTITTNTLLCSSATILLLLILHIRVAHRVPSSSTVPHGNACVEPYAQATEFTKLHTMKNGPGTHRGRKQTVTQSERD